MIFLLKYWETILIVVLGFACTLLLWRVDNLTNQRTTLKNALKASKQINLEHEQNKAFTERKENEFQASISNLRIERDRLRKRPSKCVTVTAAPLVHNGERQGGGYAQENGISDIWLIDYAEQAERLRIERNACKDFVNEHWDKK